MHEALRYLVQVTLVYCIDDNRITTKGIEL